MLTVRNLVNEIMERFLQLSIISIILPFFVIFYGQPVIGAVGTIFGLFYTFSIVGFTLTRYATQNLGFTFWDPTVILNTNTLRYSTLSIRTAQRANLETIYSMVKYSSGQLLLASLVILVVGLIIAYQIKNEHLSLILKSYTVIFVINFNLIACFLVPKQIQKFNNSVLLPISALILVIALYSLMNNLDRQFQSIMNLIFYLLTVLLAWDILIVLVFFSFDLNLLTKILGIIFLLAFQVVLNFLVKKLQTSDETVNVLSLGGLISAKLIAKKYTDYVILAVTMILTLYIMTRVMSFIMEMVNILVKGIATSLNITSIVDIIYLLIINITAIAVVVLEWFNQKAVVEFVITYLLQIVLFLFLAYFWLFFFSQFILELLAIIIIIAIIMSFVNINQFNLEERLKTAHKFTTILLIFILSDVSFLILASSGFI